jgi:hypothetical protein
MAMCIFIKPASGGALPLHVYYVYTIFDIKKMIQEKDGVPLSSQCLTYADKSLQNEQTLVDYHIEPDSFLHLYTRYGTDVHLYVKTLVGGNFTLSVKSHDKVEAIKNTIQISQEFLSTNNDL